MDEKKEETAKPPEVLISDPRSPLFAPLANLYLEDGMVDEAIQLCLSGLENFPDSLDGHLVLGKAYLEKGDLELARDELKMVLSLDAGNEEAERSLTSLQSRIEIPADPLTQVLGQLRRIQGAVSALVIGEEGVLVSENWVDSADGGKTNRLFGPLFSRAEEALSAIQFGKLKNAILEMGKRRIYLFRVARFVLAILTERSTTIGMVMLEVRRILPQIEALLPQE